MKRTVGVLSPRLWWLPALLSASLILGGCQNDGGTKPPVAVLEPASLDFGPVGLGLTADRTFMLRNAGGGTLSGTMSVSCPEFTLVSGSGAYSLAAEEVLEVTVRFQPSSAGSKSCPVVMGKTSSEMVGCSGIGVGIATGACCTPAGTCTVTADAACEAPSTWQGADTDCSPNLCSQPTGACCTPAGTCTVTADAACEAPSTWEGMATNCSPNFCAQPTGACCAPVGTCTVTTQAACSVPSIWQGAGTNCAPNLCPQPTGACCTPAGTCTLAIEAACEVPSIWRGAATTCSPNLCAQPNGACCAPAGSCTVTTEAACAAPSTWEGMATNCSPNLCPQPTGACCAPAGTCTVTTQATCAAGSTWQAVGTACSPNPCVATAACCTPAGTCTVTTQAACAPGSTWQTAGTTCSPNPCVATAACCTPAGTCTVTTQAACAPGSTWRTAGTTCSPNPCVATAACCTPAGTCTVTIQAACAPGSTWQTAGTTCSLNPCVATAACCTPAGTCTVTTQGACVAPNAWQDSVTNCSPNFCPQPAGACCAPEGACTVTTQAACEAPNAWQGAGANCSPNLCPQPVGACCTPAGTCAVATEVACVAPGAWQGAATNCSPNPCPQPTGACCAPAGTCTVTSHGGCRAPKVWQGADTNCTPSLCVATGACCAPAGTCAVTIEAACSAPAAWQGGATTCSPNLCPQPTGACCAPVGTCTVITEAACLSPSTLQAAGTNCSPNPCVATAACCTPAGTCTVTAHAACAAGSTWQAPGTNCSPNPCVATAACCTPAGTCTVTAHAACAAGSTWQAPGTNCSPNPCVATAACCTPAGACTVTTQAACAAGSTWQAAGTTCSPNPCVATAACCAPAGTCTVTTQTVCTAGSTWQTAGTNCSPNICPQPTGACCSPATNCTVSTQAACSAPNTWRGLGTSCTPNPCPAPTITVSPSSLPGGMVGTAYAQTISAGGGTAPYGFAVSAGVLPAGLVLSTSGILDGTPSAAGTSTFTITATDAASFTGSRAYSVTMAVSGLDLTVPTVYITQSTQTPAFDVPLVKDRAGYLRVFVRASEANSATPQVRVSVFNGSGSLLQTYTIQAPGAAVPTSVNESNLSYSWNVAIPGTLIQPGYSMAVEVDPDHLIAEADDANNVWPSPGSTRALDVRNLPVLDMTLVPVHTGSSTGNVNVGNADAFMDYTRRLHPIPSYSVQIHATMNSTATLAANGDGWVTMLTEVRALRTVDSSSRYYFGVAHVTYGSGVAGIGYVGLPVATGWDYQPGTSGTWVLAHEIGHNWDCLHTSCSTNPPESGPDPAYPYAGGVIGAYGYDLWASSSPLKDKTTYKDVMSYCNPQWISDYTYKKILAFRESSPIGLREQSKDGLPKESCLLVWGLRKDGEMILEPSFLISTRPSLPAPGPYRVEGVDVSGRLLWSREFDLTPSIDANDPTSAGFCFAVPMSGELLDQIGALRIVKNGEELVGRASTGPSQGKGFRQIPAKAALTRLGAEAVDFAWDSSLAPLVMVRDLERDECIGFARDGNMRLITPSQRLELLFSDGVHTRVQQWSAE